MAYLRSLATEPSQARPGPASVGLVARTRCLAEYTHTVTHTQAVNDRASAVNLPRWNMMILHTSEFASNISTAIVHGKELSHRCIPTSYTDNAIKWLVRWNWQDNLHE